MTNVEKINLPTKPPKPPRDPFLVRLRRKIDGFKENHLGSHTTAKWARIPYPVIDLVYWRPGNEVNFGDELARTVVELMLGRHGYTVFDEVARQRRILAIGSIIHLAKDGDVIWGSGVNGSVVAAAHTYKNLDVRAVRGPLTRKFLQDRGVQVPEVYGDPGLLIHRLTGSRFLSEKKYKIGLVPNLYDMRFIVENTILANFPEIHLINPKQSWNRVIAEINQCEYILASSLHGLVISDAYSIPSNFVRFTEFEGIFKYRDYYEGTGRDARPHPSIEEALAAGPVAPLNIDLDQLERSFPLDIWDT